MSAALIALVGLIYAIVSIILMAINILSLLFPLFSLMAAGEDPSEAVTLPLAWGVGWRGIGISLFSIYVVHFGRPLLVWAWRLFKAGTGINDGGIIEHGIEAAGSLADTAVGAIGSGTRTVIDAAGKAAPSLEQAAGEWFNPSVFGVVSNEFQRTTGKRPVHIAATATFDDSTSETHQYGKTPAKTAAAVSGDTTQPAPNTIKPVAAAPAAAAPAAPGSPALAQGT